MNPLKNYLSIRLTQNQVLPVCDAVAAFLSLYFTLRLAEGKALTTLQMPLVLKNCLVFTLVAMGLACWMQFNRNASLPQTITREGIFKILAYGTLANLFYYPLMGLTGELPALTPVLNIFLFTGALAVPRFVLSHYSLGNAKPDITKPDSVKTIAGDPVSQIPAVVVGYNSRIAAYLNSYNANGRPAAACPYAISGIILIHPLKVHPLKENEPSPSFPVLGMVQDMIPLVQKLSEEGCTPQRLLVAEEALHHLPLQQMLLKFHRQGLLSLVFETIPFLEKVRLRPFCFTDLLGKAALEAETGENGGSFPDESPSSGWKEALALFDGATVMVTGIQDPVLSYLACCMAEFFPRQIIAVSPSEHALADLKIKLRLLHPQTDCKTECHYILASVTDHETMDRLVKNHHPDVIFHGDRLTHPGLMADNPALAVQKNISSALHLAQSAQKTCARLFVMVNAHASTALSHSIRAVISRGMLALDQASPKGSTRFLTINNCDVWDNLESPTAFWEKRLAQGSGIEIPSADGFSWLLSAQESAGAILRAAVKALRNEKTRGQMLTLHGNEPSRFHDLVKSLSLLYGYHFESQVKVNAPSDSLPDSSKDSPEGTFGKPLPASAFYSPDMQELLTPGVTLSALPFCEAQNQGYILKLTDMAEKGQNAKITNFLEKMTFKDAPEEAPLSLKLAG